MTRRRIVIAVTAALAVFGSVLVVLDALALLQPRPPSAALLERMRQTWDNTQSYRGIIIAGPWRQGPPSGSEQWYHKNGDLVMLVKESGGFSHLERWRGATWEYFQPGAGFEAQVKVARFERAPYARWAISRLPSMEDLVRVLQEASDVRVLEPATITSVQAWVVECRPRFPATTPRYATHRQGTDFRELMDRPWRVWLADETGLPIHVLIGPDDPGSAYGIDVTSLKTGPAPIPKPWRKVFKGDSTVKRRYRILSDALSPDSLASARGRIEADAFTWKQSIYKRSGSQPAFPGGP